MTYSAYVSGKDDREAAAFDAELARTVVLDDLATGARRERFQEAWVKKASRRRHPEPPAPRQAPRPTAGRTAAAPVVEGAEGVKGMLGAFQLRQA